ncbi:hypothetical protein BN946_scf184346.g10 [Trametes cinnabarina]|uniref:Uncharacterized protein n=1 Tax=Pycnoporus cinnabarinus TaxID=5643 RepID=A0A060SUH8_PYCCI|nr:hypothetical protein BN946_scf184346.g10 [Trametes cinnabarina]
MPDASQNPSTWPVFPDAGRKYDRCPTAFETVKAQQEAQGLSMYAPFTSEEEWEMAEFIVESGMSHNDINRMLNTKLFARCRASAPQDYRAIRSRKALLRTLDSLPGPRSQWKVIEITVTGNRRDAKGRLMRQVLYCWGRNPVDAIADLIGNPEFKDDMRYAPVEEFSDEVLAELEDADVGAAARARILSDFVNTDWWPRVQRLVAEHWPGATIAPVILCSDKTQLSVFSGDKMAWPVYLTIGNIDKDGYRLFHYVMRQLLSPLVEAGKTGVMMPCADGYVRHVFPILAAYVADFPEQCLVCCTKENRCPTCLVRQDQRGELLNSCYRDPEATLAALHNPASEQLAEAGLRDIPDPFWADLPYANIFNCIVPALLHQLHKGVFMSHLVQWIAKGHEDELDARFQRVPPYPGLRIFSQGISTISQWTGNEFRQMEKVFVGLIDGLHADTRVVAAARAMLDFIYLAHYPSHTASTLQQMRDALERFHANKAVFQDLGIREHFNIPKLHWLLHYISSIIDFGSCDGLSTEVPERLHIDFAKSAYRASNRKDYVRQMVTWLTRREKVRWFQGFLRWCGMVQNHADESETDNADDNWEEDDDTDVLDPDGETRWDTLALDALADTSSLDYDLDSPAPSTALAQDDPRALASYMSKTIDTSLERTGSTTDGRTGWDNQEDLDTEDSDMIVGPYKIARKPSLGVISGATIATALGVIDFAPALAAFLAGDGFAGPQPSEHSLLQHSYPVFKQFSRVLPSLRGYAREVFADRIFARPATNGLPPRYSTVLYVEKPDIAETIGVKGTSSACDSYRSSSHLNWNLGYRIGHVRLIFTLPPDLQRRRPHATDTFSHLAYLELYTPFSSSPERPVGLYKVAKSYSGMKRKAVIVPLTRIFRSCHLLPVCGQMIDRSWSSETVVDECDVMYLNSFSDHHMYLFVE